MSDCDLSNTTVAAAEWIQYISKEIILPMYMFIGTGCNIVLLIAFYKQSKSEKPYVYQVLLTASKTLEMTMFGCYLMGQDWWSGMLTEGADWFKKSYFFMFTTFNVIGVCHIHLLIGSILLTAAMAADRAFTLCFPVKYKTINHRRHRLVAALICCTFPFVSSISSVWFWKLSWEGDHYTVGVNTEFASTTLSQLCFKIGLFLRLISVFTTIILNAINVRVFNKRSNVMASLGQESMTKEAKELEKTVFLLSVSQSVFMCFNQIPHCVLHVMLYTTSNFSTCHAPLAIPLADGFVFVTDMFDLAAVLIINKRMRSLVARAVGWGCWNNVKPITGVGAQSSQEAKGNAASQRVKNTSSVVHG